MNMGEVGWGLALQTLAFVSYNLREMRPGPSRNRGEAGWGAERRGLEIAQ